MTRYLNKGYAKAIPVFSTLFVLFVTLFGSNAQASHFRFGHFTWEHRPDVSEYTVDFTLVVAFRKSYFISGTPSLGQVFKPGGFNFGDGQAANFDFEIIAFNVQEDWILGRAKTNGGEPGVVRHTYSAANQNGQPYLAYLGSCCRIGSLRNSGGSSYTVETKVDLTEGNSSPLSSLPPIVTCPRGDCDFLVPAVDKDGDTLRWRLATSSESGITSVPVGLSIDSNTGYIQWQGSASSSLGLYATQVVIEDLDEQGNAKSSVAIDFIINHQEFANNNPPAFDHPPSPQDGERVIAIVGQELLINLQATDPDVADNVFIGHVGLPKNATLDTAAAQTSATAVMRWTPTTTDIGEKLITFTVNDDKGSAAKPLGITIEVIKPAISNIRVIDTIESSDIDIDASSYSIAPFSVTETGSNTVVEWRFASFDVGQIESLEMDLQLKNLQPGEHRKVIHTVELSYNDVNGNEVKRVLGEEFVDVANTVFSLNVATDKQQYKHNETVAISASLTNLSTFAADAHVTLSVTDATGQVLATFTGEEVKQAGANVAIDLVPQTFSTANIMVGNYRVIASLQDKFTGETLVSAADFIVTTANGTMLDMAANVVTDKQTYQAWDTVAIEARVINQAANAIYDGGSAELLVKGPVGNVLLQETYTLNSISPSALSDRSKTLNISDAMAGSYQVSWTVYDQLDNEVAISNTGFLVEKDSLQALKGTSSVASKRVYHTEPNRCDFSVTNVGEQSIDNVTLNYQLIEFTGGAKLLEESETLNFSGKKSQVKQLEIATDDLAYGTYACVVQARVDGRLLDLSATAFEVMPPKLEAHMSESDRGRLLVLLDEPKQCQLLQSITVDLLFDKPELLYVGKTFDITLKNSAGDILDVESISYSQIGDSINQNTSENDLTVKFNRFTGVMQVSVATPSSLLNGGYHVDVELHEWFSSKNKQWVLNTDCQRSLATGKWKARQKLVAYQQNPDLTQWFDEEPNGPVLAPNLSTQRHWLDSVLQSADWNYNIVTNADAFTREFNSGDYQLYAIFAERTEIDIWTQKALREAVNRGAGLIYGGANDIRHLGLQPALGVHWLGAHKFANSVNVTDARLGQPGDVTTLPFVDTVFTVAQHGVEVLAEFNFHHHDEVEFEHWFPDYKHDHWRDNLRHADDNSTEGDQLIDWHHWYDDEHFSCHREHNYSWIGTLSEWLWSGEIWKPSAGNCDYDWLHLKRTAVTLNSYGAGKAIFVGYDQMVVGSHESGIGMQADLILQSLELIHPTVIESISGDLSHSVLDVDNLAIATPGRVLLSLSNTELADADDFTVNAGQWIWEFDIAVSQTLTQNLYFRLPVTDESATVTAQIQSVRDGDYLDQQLLTFTFQAGRDPLAMADTVESAYQLREIFPYVLRYRAIYKKLLFINHGLIDFHPEWAYKSLLMVSNMLLLDPRPEAKALRLEVDEQIQQVARRLN